MPDPFRAEIFCNTQSKSKPKSLSEPSLACEAILCGLVACYMGKETGTQLSKTFQVVVENDKVPSEYLFLQAKHLQIPQLLLIITVL